MKEKMKHKKFTIKSSVLVGGRRKLRKVTEAEIKAYEEEHKRVAKAMKGFKRDEDVVPTRDIEKAESAPEWIGGGVYDPRWDDVYLDYPPNETALQRMAEVAAREGRPFDKQKYYQECVESWKESCERDAEELAERRAIMQKAGQEAADLLNRFYRLGKYATQR